MLQERGYKNSGKEMKADKLDCEASWTCYVSVQRLIVLGHSGYEQ